MNHITEVTRQDIIDVIKDGIWISFEEPQYSSKSGQFVDGCYYRMPIYGRLSELEFLKRIYDLNNMPSKDKRFSNATDEIWQHTVNNNDWDRYWYFLDDRFQLSNGNEDEFLLCFICEMLHPAVRIEQRHWRKYLDKFNEILKQDGYHLVATKKISGREVFEAQEIDGIIITHSNEKIYCMMKLIDSGSYANVFSYTDPYYKKNFALKRAKDGLNDKERQRFKKEFETMKRLHSPYVVEVYAYNETKNEYTMEFMDYTLKKYIDKYNSSMTLQERKNIIIQLLHAYKYLHSKKIFHRDISFTNVLLKKYDDVFVVKLSDFGLIKVEDSDLTSENTELKGSLNDPALKTEGFSNYNLSHELYAITLLFTFVLTGKTNWSQIDNSIVDTFLKKGTNSEKSKRFQTFDELINGLKLCFSELEMRFESKKN